MSTIDNLIARLSQLTRSLRESATMAEPVASHTARDQGRDQGLDHVLDQASKIAKALWPYRNQAGSHQEDDHGEEQPPAAALPKGLIIYGKGCGCGGLARAIAREVNAQFITGTTCEPSGRARGKDSVAHYFNQAKGLAQVAAGGRPVILYLSGANALTSVPAELQLEAQATTAEIAKQMQNMSENSNVLVVLEAEKLSQIDATLLADGRFDVQIEVEKPDYKGRLTIFRQHLESCHDLPQPQSKSSSQLQGVQILVSLDGVWRDERLGELDQICQECAILADGLHADRIYRALFQLRTQAAITGSVTAEQLYQAIENQQGKP